MLKLVATDLDGTLLHTDGTVTARTRRVLTAVEDMGITVVFVTARPIRWMDDLWEHVGGHGLAICSNGGIVYDVHAREVRKARTIPVDVGLEVADVLREALPGTTFALETTEGFGKEPAFMTRFPPPPDLSVGPLAEILDGSVVKLLARHEDMEPEKFWAAVESQVGHLVTTTWSSAGALVEISASGVTKASTLEILCAERHIDASEVVAFGDIPNDLPMRAAVLNICAPPFGKFRSAKDSGTYADVKNSMEVMECLPTTRATQLGECSRHLPQGC